MRILAITLCLILTSCENLNLGDLNQLAGASLDEKTIADGLKQALEKGVDSSTKRLSSKGGYYRGVYKIVIPQEVQKVTDKLKQFGFGGYVNSFELKMNEAAEKAAEKAKPVFISALKSMTLEDARKILMGNETAATDFFKRKTSAKLRAQYLPIIRTKMNEVGVVNHYNKMISQYNKFPLTKKVDFKLENYVADKALEGLFSLLAEKEKDIRKNPVQRTTALLRRVFAAQDK